MLKEIRAVIKFFQPRKISVPDCFTAEFYQTFKKKKKKEQIAILLKLFHLLETEWPNLFYEVTVMLIPKI